VIVCDTGPLVAAAIADDAHHRECVDLFASLHLAGRHIVVPGRRRGGLSACPHGWGTHRGQFLTSLAERTFSTVELTVDDYRRAAELVLTYEDLPLGTTDATVIALCERLGLSEVATLDRRHFTVVRPRHVEALTLLPE
jgi:predicted nucleic acid-binding protein